MSRKYELVSDVNDTTDNNGDKSKNPKLYRIMALRDIGDNVKQGDLGGYVECEGNLSQGGDCWIYGDAKVHGDARVENNATIEGRSVIEGNSIVMGSVSVSDSVVTDNVIVSGDSCVYKSTLSGYAVVLNTSMIDNSALEGNVVLDGGDLINSFMIGRAYVCGSRVEGSDLCGYVRVCGTNTKLDGITISGHTYIGSPCGDSTIVVSHVVLSDGAHIESQNDFFTAGIPTKYGLEEVSMYRNHNGGIDITTPHFNGELVKFKSMFLNKLDLSNKGDLDCYNKYEKLLEFSSTVFPELIV